MNGRTAKMDMDMDTDTDDRCAARQQLRVASHRRIISSASVADLQCVLVGGICRDRIVVVSMGVGYGRDIPSSIFSSDSLTLHSIFLMKSVPFVVALPCSTIWSWIC